MKVAACVVTSVMRPQTNVCAYMQKKMHSWKRAVSELEMMLSCIVIRKDLYHIRLHPLTILP